MLKIFVLAATAFIVVRSVRGGIVRREADDEVETTTKKLLRVPLKKFDPVREIELSEFPEGKRRRRQIDSGEFDRLSPFEDEVNREIEEELNLNAVKPSANEDAKGFEGREEEERLSQLTNDPFYELLAEVTEGGRSPTDDELQRFDVGSTTTGHQKFATFDELSLFGEK